MTDVASSSSKLEENAVFTEDIAPWIKAIKNYLKETKANCLDLEYLEISFEEIAFVLKLLPESEVTELSLGRYTSIFGEKIFCELLKETKIKKLSLEDPHLMHHILAVLDVLDHSEINDLCKARFDFEKINEEKLIPRLFQSRLTKLDFRILPTDKLSALSIANELPNSSLTRFCIYANIGGLENLDNLVPVFAKLPHCQIKDLDLSRNQIGFNTSVIKELSQNLATSKIEKLNLSSNKISDSELDVLAQGLVNSNVMELNLSENQITGLNDFAQCLPLTKIRALDFSYNPIKHRQMFNFPDFLRSTFVESLNFRSCHFSDKVGAELMKSIQSSKLVKLDLSMCENLGFETIHQFAVILKNTSLENVNVSLIDFSSRMFEFLYGCFRGSKLKSFQFSGWNGPSTTSCLNVLKTIKNTSVFSIGMPESHFSPNHFELFAEVLRNATLTHFDLHSCTLESILAALALSLKRTTITHLNLSHCDIQDVGVKTLGSYLKGSQIMELHLDWNEITSVGAKALAVSSPPSLIYLNLEYNKIKNDGLEILAERFAHSFVTTLLVKHNVGKRVLPIDKILWENRKLSQMLLSLKGIFPENSDGIFCFNQCINDTNVSDFLEKCLHLYKTVKQQPAVINVFLCEGSWNISKKELTDLFEKFPHQLVEFICKWVDADASQHIEFLMKAEELGLVTVVELLLLNRPLYMLDEVRGILHPRFYELLLKYKQPICSLAVDPEGISKIIEYFTQHVDVDGSADIINLLTELKIT